MRAEKRGMILIMTVVFLLALTFSAAQATTVTWNFDVPNGIVASPHTYLDTTNTFAIVASGFTTTIAAPTSGSGAWSLGTVASTPLFGKNTPGDLGETGLGLANFVNFEIQPMTLIQLDLQDLINKALVDEVKIISSLQLGEAFAIFGSNTAAATGGTGTFLGRGTGTGAPGDTATFSILGPPPFRYEWITSNNVDVLLRNGLSATTSVPEPACLLLLGSGLLGLAACGRKLKK